MGPIARVHSTAALLHEPLLCAEGAAGNTTKDATNEYQGGRIQHSLRAVIDTKGNYGGEPKHSVRLVPST